MKKSMVKFTLPLLLVISLISNAQNERQEKSNLKQDTFVGTKSSDEGASNQKRLGTSARNNWSAHLGIFDPWAGIYYERLISPYWGFDAAAGVLGGSIGTKVYYPKLSNGKFSLYSGVSRGVLLLIGSKSYIPMGLTYLGKKGFRVSFDVGPHIYDDNTPNSLGLVLKLGYSY